MTTCNLAKALMAFALFISLTNLKADEAANSKQLERGKAVYMSTCIACHNRDPNKKGSIGPELVGTPLEVMMLKVPKGEYPKDYTPKRKTKIMQKWPQFAKDVPAIHAWIESVKKK